MSNRRNPTDFDQYPSLSGHYFDEPKEEKERMTQGQRLKITGIVMGAILAVLLIIMFTIISFATGLWPAGVFFILLLIAGIVYAATFIPWSEW